MLSGHTGMAALCFVALTVWTPAAILGTWRYAQMAWTTGHTDVHQTAIRPAQWIGFAVAFSAFGILLMSLPPEAWTGVK
jgi:drug/metabolite transporter (DMT)-like permease